MTTEPNITPDLREAAARALEWLEKNVGRNNINWEGTYIYAADLRAALAAQPREQPTRDNCKVCHGANGGVKGNENIIYGVVMCDYCHAATMDAFKKAKAEAAREQSEHAVPSGALIKAVAGDGKVLDYAQRLRNGDCDIGVLVGIILRVAYAIDAAPLAPATTGGGVEAAAIRIAAERAIKLSRDGADDDGIAIKTFHAIATPETVLAALSAAPVPAKPADNLFDLVVALACAYTESDAYRSALEKINQQRYYDNPAAHEMALIADHALKTIQPLDAAPLAPATAGGGWISTKDALPEKPGKADYEQIPCLIYLKGEVRVSLWNCEHLVWDDSDGDDFLAKPREPTHWQPLLPPAPTQEA